MIWTEEIIRQLKDEWAAGTATAEIARRLGASKNAIVGKAHRLDLEARPSPIRRDPAKPAAERPAAHPRIAGPTLPPLASAIIRPVPPRVSNVQPLRSEPPLGRQPVTPPPVVTTPPPVVTPPAPVVTPPPPVVTPPPPVVTPPPPVRARRSAPSCCWPIGSPRERTFRFCDDSAVPGKPYCPEHAKLAYVKVRDRKQDAA
jgi:GcrA cell cycle regulator